MKEERFLKGIFLLFDNIESLGLLKMGKFQIYLLIKESNFDVDDDKSQLFY